MNPKVEAEINKLKQLTPSNPVVAVSASPEVTKLDDELAKAERELKLTEIKLKRLEAEGRLQAPERIASQLAQLSQMKAGLDAREAKLAEREQAMTAKEDRFDFELHIREDKFEELHKVRLAEIAEFEDTKQLIITALERYLNLSTLFINRLRNFLRDYKEFALPAMPEADVLSRNMKKFVERHNAMTELYNELIEAEASKKPKDIVKPEASKKPEVKPNEIPEEYQTD